MDSVKLTLIGTIAAGIGVVLLFLGAWLGDRRNQQDHMRFEERTDALTDQTRVLASFTAAGFERAEYRFDELRDILERQAESRDGDPPPPAEGGEGGSDGRDDDSF